MVGEVVLQRLGQREPRGPQAAAAEVRGQQLGAAAAGEVDPLARPAAAVRVVAVAQLDHPALVAVVRPRAPRRQGERRREVDAQAAGDGERRGEGGARVDDQQVAGLEQVGEVEEGGVAEAGARGDQHPHAVALGRRLGRLERAGSSNASAALVSASVQAGSPA